MKKIHLLLVLIVIGLAPVTQVRADSLVISLDPTNYTNPQWVNPSNLATEEAWLVGLFGGAKVELLGKDEDNLWNDGKWTQGDPTLDWTIAILKYDVGTPCIPNPDHWAIRDDGDHIVDLGDISDLPSGGLSYIVYLGGVPIPEPATMFLFGAGLAGFGVLRKRLKKASSTPLR